MPGPSLFDFRASRPGHIFEIKAALHQNRVMVHRIDLNFWGVMQRSTHIHRVRMNDPSNTRDWSLTTIWAVSMDGLSVGLILMVLSSFYMWWGLMPKRTLGLLALGLGVLSCGFFVVGLRWLVINNWSVSVIASTNDKVLPLGCSPTKVFELSGSGGTLRRLLPLGPPHCARTSE